MESRVDRIIGLFICDLNVVNMSLLRLVLVT